MHRWLLLALVACSSNPKTSTAVSDAAPPQYADLVAQVTKHLYELDPATAVARGVHEYDGALPDRSSQVLAQQTAQLQRDLAALQAQTGLAPAQAFERDVLVQDLRRRLFDLVDLDLPHRDPLEALGAINLDGYVIRDYAPVAARAAAVVQMCRGLAPYFAQARGNLKLPMPRAWIDIALLQTRGYIDFADKDIRRELASAPNQAELGPALDACKSALAEHVAWLEAQQPSGTTDFALGEAKYLKMLRETQGVDVTLAQLSAIADEDLRRNTAAIEAAARDFNRKLPMRAALERATEKPPATEVIKLGTEQSALMKQFVVEHKIAAIPSTNPVEVRESPAFMRWNFAFINVPGPLEKKQMPSYYYISPPDPKWPAAEQQAYIPGRADLLFTTIHEVWPGHFLHFLHVKKNASPVLQNTCTYTTVEGWAHYTEEMMYDAGVGEQSPIVRIGMVRNALLRDVRFLSSLGLHTKGMTVEQSTKLFQEKAFVDPGTARQQAARGTFDPLYLSYTLGKLMIRKLHADWAKQHPNASLGEFHDEFLSYACAPLPLIRRAMLGPNAGSPL